MPRMVMTAEEVSGSQRVIRGLSTRKRAISLRRIDHQDSDGDQHGGQADAERHDQE